MYVACTMCRKKCAKALLSGESMSWYIDHVNNQDKRRKSCCFSLTLTAAVANFKNCSSNSFSVVRDRVFVGRADKRTDRTQLSRSIFQAHASFAHQQRNGRSLTMRSLYTLCTAYYINITSQYIAYATYCLVCTSPV